MQLPTANQSYTEFGLTLPRSIEDICIQLEKEGWRVWCLRGTRLRYWCACERGHQLWVDTASAAVDARLDFKLARTCFTFKEG